MRHGSTTSPKVCSTDRLYMSNMCPPTMVGLRVKSAKLTSRRMLSGSSTMSSSSRMT